MKEVQGAEMQKAEDLERIKRRALKIASLIDGTELTGQEIEVILENAAEITHMVVRLPHEMI